MEIANFFVRIINISFLKGGEIMNIEAKGISDVGMRREKNEDSYLLNNELSLFVVADGMGGHVGGEFASRLAVQTIEDVIYTIERNSDTSILEDNKISPSDYRSQLKFAVQTASHRIYEEAVKDSSLRGMGTTAVTMWLRDGRIFIANVGDSRAYLIRNKEIYQLTEDHSLVGEQLRAGVISEVAAKGHKLKNIITRSVGFQNEVEIDVIIKVPRNGDRFLLCSDGLTNMLDDEELLEVVSDGSTVKDASQVLVDMANSRGGDDNITVILAEISGIDNSIDLQEPDDESTIGI